jgi:hypothetical protein
MKKSYWIVLTLLLVFIPIIAYGSPEASKAKIVRAYAIVVDNTDAPTGSGTVVMYSIWTPQQYSCNVTNGSTCYFNNIPEGPYNIVGCVVSETAQISNYTVGSDTTLTLNYNVGSCP